MHPEKYEELKKYIEEQQAIGIPRETIAESLVTSGWDKKYVHEALFGEVNMIEPETESETNESKSFASVFIFSLISFAGYFVAFLFLDDGITTLFWLFVFTSPIIGFTLFLKLFAKSFSIKDKTEQKELRNKARSLLGTSIFTFFFTGMIAFVIGFAVCVYTLSNAW